MELEMKVKRAILKEMPPRYQGSRKKIKSRILDEDEARPGFLETDLVSHDGGKAQGDFCYSLNAWDVTSGWTEAEALRNRAQVWTFRVLKKIKERLAFKLLGIDLGNKECYVKEKIFIKLFYKPSGLTKIFL